MASSGREVLQLPSTSCTQHTSSSTPLSLASSSSAPSPSGLSSGLPATSHNLITTATSVASKPAQPRRPPLMSSAAEITITTRVSSSAAGTRPRPAFVSTLTPTLASSPIPAATAQPSQSASANSGPGIAKSPFYSAVVSKRKAPTSPTKPVSTSQKAPKRKSSLVHEYDPGSEYSPALRSSSQKLHPPSVPKEEHVPTSHALSTFPSVADPCSGIA